jgi:phosphate transport system substrate-binding protein
MRGLRLVCFTLAVSVVMLSCNDDKGPKDTLSKGAIDIAADETFMPAIEQEKIIFDSSYPDAHISIHYKPESACFQDYFDKKAHLILVTRELSAAEKKLCDQKQIAPSSVKLAEDAIAVIVNNASPDSTFDKPALKGILSGEMNKKYTVVFDNEGSSTVRFIMDSILRGQKLGSNVYAAHGNKEVIDYVAKNPGAIGFVGIGYVSDSSDPGNTGAFIHNVRVAAVQSDSNTNFYKPYQAYIALKYYPLVRKVYYISQESYPGLGTGFANFLMSPRGQLIFARAHLFPLKMDIVIRDAEVNH